MSHLVTVGFMTLLLGLALYNFCSRVSDWTVQYYYIWSGGKRLTYLSIVKFYGLMSLGLIVLGAIIGIIGLLVLILK